MSAVKRFVEKQSAYLEKPGVERSEFLDNLNVDAIAVSDVLHNEKNQQHYNLNIDSFKLHKDRVNNKFNRKLRNYKCLCIYGIQQ